MRTAGRTQPAPLSLTAVETRLMSVMRTVKNTKHAATHTCDLNASAPIGLGSGLGSGFVLGFVRLVVRLKRVQVRVG